MSEFSIDTFNILGIVFDSEKMAELLAADLTFYMEMRIGESISNGLSRELIEEFDLIDDPIEAHDWLEKNRPDYKDIVQKRKAEMRRELLVYRSRLSGVRLTRDLEEDTTPIEQLGLPGLKDVGIETVGRLVDSLDSIPGHIEQKDVVELINRLWDYLTDPRTQSSEPHLLSNRGEDVFSPGTDIIHPDYGRGTVTNIFPDTDSPLIRVEFHSNGVAYLLSEAWVKKYCKVANCSEDKPHHR